jgi:hypothetical protein
MTEAAGTREGAAGRSPPWTASRRSSARTAPTPRSTAAASRSTSSPLDQRGISATEVINRLGRSSRRSRDQALHAAGAGPHRGRSREPHRVSVHAGRSQPERAEHVVHDLVAKFKQLPQLADVVTDQQLGGLATSLVHRPRHGFALRHHAADHRQHALRRLRPAPDQHAVHAAESVSRDSGDRSEFPARIRKAARYLYPVFARAGTVDRGGVEHRGLVLGRRLRRQRHPRQRAADTSSTTGVLSFQSSTSALSTGKQRHDAVRSVNSTSALSPSSTAVTEQPVAVERQHLHRHLLERQHVAERHLARSTTSSGDPQRAEAADLPPADPGQTPVPLSAFTHFQTQSESLSIAHPGTVSGRHHLVQSGGGYSLGQALDAMNKVIAAAKCRPA